MPIGASIWGPILAGTAGPLLGTLLNSGAQGGRTNEINQLIQSLMMQFGQGQQGAFGQTGNSIYGPVKDNALTGIDRSNQFLYGNEGDPGGALNRFNTGNQAMFDPSSLLQAFMGGQFDPYGQNIPGVSGALSQMGGLTSAMGGQNDIARQLFAGGGWTPQSQQFFDTISPMTQGQTLPQQGLTNMANNIFSSNGMSQNPLSSSFMNAAAQGITGSNPNLDFAQRGAQGIFSQGGQTGPTNQGIGQALGMSENGGMTPAINNMMGIGFNTLMSGGQTPNGARGEQSALDIMNQGGATPTTDFLQSRGANLANRESLLPMNQVASMASDRAATDYGNNMQAAQRQALARGGGPGATVANGLQNAAMADYADKGSQTEARAVQDALVQQQGLQLQQAAMGANMAESGAGLMNSRYGTAGGILGNLENTAANRFGIGGNLVTSGQNAATNRAGTGLGALDQLAGLQSNRQMGALGQIPNISQTGTNQANVFGNLGLGSNAQNLQALGLGAGMYGDVNNSSLGGLNAMNSRISNQGQYALGGGQLANSGSTDISSILNQILGGNISAGQQGLSRTGGYYNAGNLGLGNQNDLMKFMGGQGQFSQQSGMNLLAQMLGLGTGSLNTLMSLYSPRSQTATNPFAGILSGAITGGLNQIPGLSGGEDPSIKP